MDMIIERNVMYGELIECEDCARSIEIMEQESICPGCGHIAWCNHLTLEPRCDPYNTAIPRERPDDLKNEHDAHRALAAIAHPDDQENEKALARIAGAKRISDNIFKTIKDITDTYRRNL